MDELKRLIDVLGGMRATANVLKVSPVTVKNYLSGNIPDTQKQHIGLLLELPLERLKALGGVESYEEGTQKYSSRLVDLVLEYRKCKGKPINVEEWDSLVREAEKETNETPNETKRGE